MSDPTTTFSLGMLSFPIWGAAITGFVTSALWVFKEVKTDRQNAKSAKNERERFIKALYAEIDFNTYDMEVFIKYSESLSIVRKSIESDKKFLPHVTDARHRDIYKSNINLIHHTGDDYIGNVVIFYGIMEKILAEIEGVYRPSYKVISNAGRISVVDDILNYAIECAAIGSIILWDMKAAYPEYKLTRKMRMAPEPPSGAILKERMEKLKSDLDRAGSTHGVNS